MKRLVLLVLLVLVVPGCAALSQAKPYVSSAADVARALCAAYEAEKEKVSVPEAFSTFCADEKYWGPFLDEVRAKQADARTGVPLKTAALPERCAPVATPAPASSSSTAPAPTPARPLATHPPTSRPPP